MNLSHTIFMQRALSLAIRGKGDVSPNPCVGAVIVNNGEIVGEGHHAFFGGPHAEVVALKRAGDKARGGTLYVTLEPCVHFGKTPPCAPQIVDAGIKQVYIAMEDPNPAVKGRGVAFLKKSRLATTVGVEGESAAAMNPAFITLMSQKRPYVLLKTAMTLDGKIATAGGQSRWITSEPARRLVHKFRSESDAVLIGAETAQLDNPELTSHGSGRNPLRVVLDPRLRTAENLRLYQTERAKTLVVTGERPPLAKRKRLEKKGVAVLGLPEKSGNLNLRLLLRYLAELNVSQLFVEGGGETTWHFVRDNLIDEMLFFVAPIILGGRGARTPVAGDGFSSMTRALKVDYLSVTRFGPDLLVKAKVIKK